MDLKSLNIKRITIWAPPHFSPRGCCVYTNMFQMEISAGFNLKNNVYTVIKREGVFLYAAFAMSVSLTN
jgi:hypothetical protein